MSTLQVKLNGLIITPGIFSAISQTDSTTRNYDNFPAEVMYTGLDDWSQVQADIINLVITIRNADAASQITFTVI